MIKPELLMPVGTIESYFAAKEGGADAVYMGMKKFNARQRAENLTLQQLHAVVIDAKKDGIKTYITLNTVIKNSELSELIDILHQISQLNTDALIIQDWGVYYLANKYFPDLVLHASTQMGVHNSIGTHFSAKRKIQRVILARELTNNELSSIARKSETELEVFAHGALCYSFSGMCLFSSYLGGMSANRGNCKQPCRRLFSAGGDTTYLFSLKDNQLIDYLSQIMKLGVHAIKVEGRMKPAEYVYYVAKAYRMAIDDPTTIEEAKKVLQLDLAREKTSYFFGNDVNDAHTKSAGTGIYLGKIKRVVSGSFQLKTDFKLETGNRLRIRNIHTDEQTNVKITALKDENGFKVIQTNSPDVFNIGDQVFLANIRQKKFPTTIEEKKINIQVKLPDNKKDKILKSFSSPGKPNREKLFLRIDSLDWLRKVRLEEVDGLILALSKRDFKTLDMKARFLQSNKKKIFVELPKFISEKDISYYRSLCRDILNMGYKQFFINHLSQKEIIPENFFISTTENVYVFNDASVQQLKEEGVQYYIAPFENDLDNLRAANDRNAIVPVYFTPSLFYSRMPVNTGLRDSSIIDDMNNEFQKVIKDGITITVPEQPVSITQYKSVLQKMGYRHFLIDMSFRKPSKNVLTTVINRFRYSEQIQPSSVYNYTKGLT